MSEQIFSSEILFCGKNVILSCDALCSKAFGRDLRPKSENSLDEGDFEWLADYELGEAPQVTGETEGGYDKPYDLLEAHNKWCARQCERSVITDPGEVIILPNFKQRV